MPLPAYTFSATYESEFEDAMLRLTSLGLDSNDVEFDQHCGISPTGDGCWFQLWIWLPSCPIPDSIGDPSLFLLPPD